MSGDIPSELGRLTNLKRLNLRQNQIAGEILADLGSLTNLRYLWMDGNRLSGGIPHELSNLYNLRRLNLASNQLSGEIPAELGSLAALRELNLSSNQLTGPVPASLGNLSNLAVLQLSENRLSGEIPASLGNLTDLVILRLAPNQFTGCVPAGLRDVADNDLNELGLPYCDVVLSGLVVSPGSLIPAFDPYRSEYSASVGLTPVTVTVAPANDHSATLQFLDDSDLLLVDTDDAVEGFQVEFGGNIPAVKIRVLSQDGQASHTYVVTDLGNRYDGNDDGAIQREEVIEAIKDYFADVISREETIEVIKLYFAN